MVTGILVMEDGVVVSCEYVDRRIDGLDQRLDLSPEVELFGPAPEIIRFECRERTVGFPPYDMVYEDEHV